MDHVGHGDSTGGKRHATLRGRRASLTAMACRAPFNQPGGFLGEGA
ncbi:DUF6380 family protein, partial [Streptomyces sp. NPDC058272]